MEIWCPKEGPSEFEGIPNCFTGVIAAEFPSVVFARDRSAGNRTIELVFESATGAPSEVPVSISDEALQAAISAAVDQYLVNIAPDRIEERFQDYLTEDLGLSAAQARDLFRSDGISPFLVLMRVFVSEPHSALCFDFRCYGEEYLDEHGFSFDLVGERVDLVTPRGLMEMGSYPAFRKTDQRRKRID